MQTTSPYVGWLESVLRLFVVIFVDSYVFVVAMGVVLLQPGSEVVQLVLQYCHHSFESVHSLRCVRH